MTGAGAEAAASVYPLAGKRVWIAGHRGMVGSAVARRLAPLGCPIVAADRSEVDLTRQDDVERFVAHAAPQVVVLAAARVGGILANARDPVGFLYDNLMIAANVLRASHEAGVERLIFLGSSCIYPKLAPQPIPEAALLTGALEPTNEAYALAKIAGLRLAQFYRRQHGADFITAMPTNLYGPNDNYDPEGSHVVPALLRRFHEAKRDGASSVTIWGTGSPRREFLHVDDLADAIVFLLERYAGEEHVNVGAGRDIAIADLASLVAEVVGYRGRIEYDATKPDGTPRKLLDCSRMDALGWRARIGLREGLASTYAEFARGETPTRARAAAVIA